MVLEYIVTVWDAEEPTIYSTQVDYNCQVRNRIVSDSSR
jgi:hypothetical protein